MVPKAIEPFNEPEATSDGLILKHYSFGRALLKMRLPHIEKDLWPVLKHSNGHINFSL